VKHLHHPLVGDLHLDFERMDLPADDGLTVFINTADPGSKSAEALNLLASWTATSRRPTQRTPPTDARSQRAQSGAQTPFKPLR
jgi:hypothetical protein